MLLYIVRHGIAVDRTDPKAPPEPDRPLTAKGVQKTRAAALGLKALDAKPDLVITSPFLRAVQTAEIFAEVLAYPQDKIRVSDALKPSMNPAEILKDMDKLKAKEIMLVGHAPHVDALIAHLTGTHGAFTEMRKAGVACFDQQTSRNKWLLLWLLLPKVLRKLGD